MKVKDIYNKVKLYWPEEVEVNDKIILEGDGAKSENLSDAWYKAEQKANDQLENIMVWSMFRVLHRQMRTDQTKLEPRRLEMDLLKIELVGVLEEMGLQSILSKLE